MPEIGKPCRGGIHPSIDGVYLGGCALNNNYELIEAKSFKFIAQCRNLKQQQTNLHTIESAMNDSTPKFNGKLELSENSSELDKDKFFDQLKHLVCLYGLQNFFYLPNSQGSMTYLLDDSHLFTLDQVVQEDYQRLHEPDPVYEVQNLPSPSTPSASDSGTTMIPTNVETDDSILARFKCYDEHEFFDRAFCRLVVESCVTPALRERVSIRFSHRDDFTEATGSVYLMMVLATCHASATVDVEEAKAQFESLTLASYPGENIDALATHALKYIKLMNMGFALDIKVGSALLRKVTSTSSEQFNRKMYQLLDSTMLMEEKYSLADPRSMKSDPDYVTYGPFALCDALQTEYSRLYQLHQWPATSKKPTPQGNLTPASDPSDDTTLRKNSGGRKCYDCGSEYHLRGSPKCAHSRRNPANRNRGGGGNNGSGNGNK